MKIPLLDITFMITVGIAAMLLLASGFLLLMMVNQRKKWLLQKEMSGLKEQQQNQLIEAAVRSEEGERHRIAEMLHDEVGALLSSSRIFLVEMNTRNLSEADKHDHSKVKEMIDESIQKVRSISHNLHSTILKEFGLNEAIRHFMKTVAGGSVVNSNVSLDEEYQLSNAETDLAVYRVIQELVNNLLKHAQPRVINIASSLKGDELQFLIYHNGNGLTQEQFEELRFKPTGLGLKNIQNRIILLKGKILFTKSDSGEYTIQLSIPVTI
ncbi:MAG TPA: ATP-binding protein [Chitinophagaceae bacterium]|nr:ATP-binding protein [Chitinophagaceae bacterium]